MVKLVVLLRSGARTLAYTENYNEFLMKLEELPGLRRKAVSTVYGATGGAVPFSHIIEVYFDSREAMEAALTSPAGVEAGRILRQFAGPDAVNLFADTFEESYPYAGEEESPLTRDDSSAP